LHTYQCARELANDIYAITKNKDFARDFGLKSQIQKAAVSILSNIAEGFERGSKIEFIQFLYIAKGSCGEVRAQLQIAKDQNCLQEKEFLQLYDLCKKISGMISNFIAHLQKSAYQGEKINRPKRLQSKDKSPSNFSHLSHSSNFIK